MGDRRIEAKVLPHRRYLRNLTGKWHLAPNAADSSCSRTSAATDDDPAIAANSSSGGQTPNRHRINVSTRRFSDFAHQSRVVQPLSTPVVRLLATRRPSIMQNSKKICSARSIKHYLSKFISSCTLSFRYAAASAGFHNALAKYMLNSLIYDLATDFCLKLAKELFYL